MLTLNLILICVGPFVVVFGLLAVVERQILGEAQTIRYIARTVVAAPRRCVAAAGAAFRRARIWAPPGLLAWFPRRLRGGSR